MRRLIFGVLFALVSFSLASSQGRAAELTGSLVNFSREYPSLSLQQYILGPVCLSLPASPLDLDCNPAFLANQDRRRFRFDVVANDRIGTVNDYREKLVANDSIGIVNKVLDQREPVIARAGTGVWYQRDWWALGYVPFRGGFASSVRNQTYPAIAADIYKESEVFGKVGLFAADDHNLHVGFQARYVDRSSFRRQFDLLDAVGDPSQLSIENQRALFLEPGLSYSFDKNPWDSMVSAALTQGAVYQDGGKSAFYPVLDLGFSTSPPFAGRKLRTSTHFSNNPDLPDLFSRFRWGAIYDFDEIASLTLTIGKNVAGIGVAGHVDSVVLGAGWKTEDVAPDQWRATRVSTILFEGGLVF